MPTPAIVVRRIRADEVDLYRSVRLAALLDSPTAFGESYAEAAARPLRDYSERVAANAKAEHSLTVLAQMDDEYVGLVGGHLEEDGGAQLVSMWLAPSARGTGIATQLVDEVVAWARSSGCVRLGLCVTESNERARRFYEKCGFVATGGRRPLRSHPELFTQSMELALV